MLNRVLFLLFLSLNLFANENLAKRLILAYPLFLEKYEDNFIYFKDGSKLQFSTNNKDLSYEEIIQNSSLENQMSMKYIKIDENKNYITAKNEDDGRFRNEEFFKKIYGKNKQEIEIEKILKPLLLLDEKSDFESKEFQLYCEDIINEINNLSAKSKNELFMEEQEVRLIHNPIIIEDVRTKKFIFKNNISTMMFRAVCGNLIPYFELKFDYFNEDNPPILEIIKGPKNKFINQEINIFLANNGFFNVNIKSSKSSYR